MVVSLVSDDPRYDALYLSNYARLYVEDELKRLPGVGNAQVVRRVGFLDAAGPRSGKDARSA